jgi:hypothetical protein
LIQHSALGVPTYQDIFGVTSSRHHNTLKNFGVDLKEMQSHRMATLLIDVAAAMKEGEAPSVDLPTEGSVQEDQTMDAAEGDVDEGFYQTC